MSLSDLVSTTTPHVHPAWVGVCAVVALGLVFTRAQLVVVMFHEAGHAIASLVFGNGFSGVNLHADGDGFTHGAPLTRVAAIPTFAAGYLAPGLFGLAVAWAYASGHTTLGLFGLAVISGGFAIMSRNLFGFALSGFLAGLAVWILLGAGEFIQAVIVLVLAWVLLLGGTIDAVRRSIAVDSDHEQLAEVTGLPAVLWGIAIAAVNVWALYAGTRILLGI